MFCTIVSDSSELISGACNEEEQPFFHMKSKLREIIWQLYCNGYNEFYLNCEYIIPLWSAEVICGLKMYNDIKLNIVMPFEEQAVNWTEEQRDRYFNLHNLSDTVVMSGTHYSDDCYKKTNELMLEKCDLLAAFGKYTDKSDIVKIIRKMGISANFYVLN